MLSFEKWLWWKEKYIDRGKSLPGLNECWFHFWWNPRVIFLEHLANTNFLWRKEKYIDRGKSLPGLNERWFHFWWNPRVIFLEHLANTNFLSVLSDLFSRLVSTACENTRFSLLRVAWDGSFSWLNVPSVEERLRLFSQTMVSIIVNF